jgi:hypothetical protein
MRIRSYQPGDDSAQVEIYNAAAGQLPKFKPASAEEVARRSSDAASDAATRVYAEDGGRPVGYIAFHANGRLSYPWTLPGHETAAEPLVDSALTAMKQRGMKTAFAAYRGDWDAQKEFFLKHGFRQAREMVNLALDPLDMPTRPGSRKNPLTKLRAEDLPAIQSVGSPVLKGMSREMLERHYFQNPFFAPDALFVLRSRESDAPLAFGILVMNPAYADPHDADPNMPCYRLGAFGTEGQQTKRINGLFSFLAADERESTYLALDLMGHALSLLDEASGGTLAAQVPSDVPYLLRFYQRYFRRQGGFPVFERALA